MYTYKHAVINNVKEAMVLKESKERYVGEFGLRTRKREMQL